VRHGSSVLLFNGAELTTDRSVPARRFRADPRCLAGEGVPGAYAHVCALADAGAALAYDEPDVQQVRRDALAWWIPLLGDELVCVTTLAVDSVRYGGAITVARSPRWFGSDPFARLFPGTIVRTSLFSEVPAPTGPSIERYVGAAWPGGRFPG
jgi:hypothetical protein